MEETETKQEEAKIKLGEAKLASLLARKKEALMDHGQWEYACFAEAIDNNEAFNKDRSVNTNSDV